MAASNFRPSLSLVLAHEGGFVHHPEDPGGATNQGITQRVYDAYRRYRGLKQQSVKHIPPTEVSDIYLKSYWKLIRGDSLPCGLDYAVFDFAVNSGVGRAVRYLQRLVGVDDDGAIGMITLDAIEAAVRVDEEGMIAQYCANRMAFLRSLGTFPTFGLGWTRRVCGYSPGIQEQDTGVIDYATFMARRDQSYKMPSQIGTFAGEVTPSKAVAPLENDSFVVAEPVKTREEVKLSLAEIIKQNDLLAAAIGVEPQ
jgi:lysozyme family protein